MRSISKGALGKEPYASAVDEGGQVYSFMDANKDSKRALCIFARWNLIRDLTIEGLSFSDASSTPSGSGSPSSPGFSPLKGVQLKRYTIYAMQSLKASARTYDYEDKPFTYFPKGPLPVSIFKGVCMHACVCPESRCHCLHFIDVVGVPIR